MSARIFRSFIALGTGLCLLLVTTGPVAAVNNQIYFGYVPGNVLWIPATTDFTPIAAMSIPAGTWWVTLTATVNGSIDEGTTFVGMACQLRDGDTPLDGAAYDLNANTDPESVESLFLTSVQSSSVPWTAVMSCRSLSTTAISFEDIRISAVKGIVSGAGGPKLRTGLGNAFDFPGDSAFHTIGSVNVTAGNWLVTAKTTTLNESIAGSTNLLCRMKLSSADQDQTTDSVMDFGSQGDQGLIAGQAAHHYASSGTARYQCKGSHDFGTVQTPLVAIKAGTLSRTRFGGATSTVGTGTPIVSTFYASTPTAITAGTSFTPVATFSIPAGSWQVFFKATLNDATGARVECQLLTSDVSDHFTSFGGADYGAAGVYMQDAVLTAGHTGTVACKSSDSYATLTNMRITLLSGDSITYQTMTV